MGRPDRIKAIRRRPFPDTIAEWGAGLSHFLERALPPRDRFNAVEWAGLSTRLRLSGLQSAPISAGGKSTDILPVFPRDLSGIATAFVSSFLPIRSLAPRVQTEPGRGQSGDPPAISRRHGDGLD